MRKLILLTAALFVAMLPVRAKKALDHADFDRWEKVANYSISNDGKWATYAVNPQEGDGKLYFYDTAKGNVIEIKRGYAPKFSSNGKWAFALVKPFFNDTRKAKINKKKGFRPSSGFPCHHRSFLWGD